MGYADFADPASNLLDALEARLVAEGRSDAVVALVPNRPGAGDVLLRPRERGGGPPQPVHYDEEAVAAVGAALEAGTAAALATERLAAGAGDRWVVSFADPNTSKALHVGHLRNLALGHALASLAEAAGIEVTRQVRAGDFGRNMGEALAGYAAYGDGRTPASAGVKGDRLVGDCYARYVASAAADAAPAEADLDAALSREQHARYDEADRLLGAVAAGEPDAVALFERVRGWVLAGHEETFRRLGIRVDRQLSEADHLQAGRRLVEEAAQRGIVRREPGGAAVYETGEERFPRLLLGRDDGFPTQHLRHIAAWRATRDLVRGTRSIVVVGDEWGLLGRYARELLGRLDPGEEIHPSLTLTHGMVLTGGDVVSSSSGEAWLVDDLLDALREEPRVAALAAEHGADPERLAAMAAIGFFLGHPPAKRLTLSLGTLLDPGANAGWTLAQAWARAWDPAHDGAPDPDPADPAYRFVVAQAQRHRRLLGKAVEELDGLTLVRFHYHLARWLLDAPEPSPRVARAVRGVLAHGARALGLDGAGAPRSAAPLLA